MKQNNKEYASQQNWKLAVLTVAQILLAFGSVELTINLSGIIGMTAATAIASMEIIVLAALWLIWAYPSIKHSRNFNAWIDCLRKNGTAASGKIKEVLKEDIYDEYGDVFKTEYRFVVTYFSVAESKYKDFTTHPLGFTPAEDAVYNCTVYSVKEKPDGYVDDLGFDPFDEAKRAEHIRSRRAFGRWRKQYRHAEFKRHKKKNAKENKRKRYKNGPDFFFFLLLSGAERYSRINWFGNEVAVGFNAAGGLVTQEGR